jgi:hypothetical protein
LCQRGGGLALTTFSAQSWVVTRIAPFGSNLVGQVLSCPAKSAQPTHIRWILNDAVLPMTGVKGCGHDKDGLCELDTFISSTKARIAEVRPLSPDFM